MINIATIKNMNYKIICISVSLILLIFLGFFIYIISTPFSYNELDLNDNGFISFTEFEYVTTVEKREIMHKGKKCIEYYSVKDGLPLKVVCI